MIIFDGEKWNVPKYKITRAVVVYDDHPELYPDGIAEEVILTAEQSARLGEIRYTEMGLVDAENYVLNGAGTPPDTRSDIDKLIDLIPVENINESVMNATDEWKPDQNYPKDKYLTHEGILYKVMQSHKSQSDWAPDKAPSLFAPFLTSPTGPLPWVQPGSTNPYKIGGKVTYKGVTWTSKINANVTVPDGDVPYNRYWTDK